MQINGSGGAATFAMQKAMDEQGLGMQVLSQTVADMNQAAGAASMSTDLQNRVLAATNIGRNIDIVV